LFRFRESQQLTWEGLRDSVARRDLANIRRQAHALAGAAGNLGAAGLRQSARALELAAGQEKEDLAELVGQVDRCAAIVFQSIDGLRSQAGQPGKPPIQTTPPADPAVVRVLLERLRTALRDGEVVGSAELLQELGGLNFPQDGNGPMARLREFIDDYEYDKAAETVETLLAGFSSRGKP
jgi:HPt (histidine-containing phosphotransfer) domain-containing protein